MSISSPTSRLILLICYAVPLILGDENINLFGSALDKRRYDGREIILGFRHIQLLLKKRNKPILYVFEYIGTKSPKVHGNDRIRRQRIPSLAVILGK